MRTPAARQAAGRLASASHPVSVLAAELTGQPVPFFQKSRRSDAGPVGVVDQHQVGLSLAFQRSDRGQPPADVGIYRESTDQPGLGPVVQANDDPVVGAAPGDLPGPPAGR